MTEQEILALEPALASFLQPVLFCCDYTQTFDHLVTYCHGLLSDLPRKSIEPIALAAGTPVRTLQEFLKDHGWSFPKVRAQAHQRVAAFLPTCVDPDGLGILGILDETGIAKKGTKTPGVARQHCGELGKLDNCVVTVHLAVAKGRFKTLIDSDLFLPEEWDQDRERCQAAGIPDDVHHRPKSSIALEEIDRALANGLHFDWLTFDEGYGKCPAFLHALDDRGLRYVGEVPKTFSCFIRKPAGSSTGTPLVDLVEHNAAFRKQTAVRLRLSRQTLGDQFWLVKATRGWLKQGGTAKPVWLMVATNEQTGEVKYFVSNAKAGVSVRRLMQVAFRRWNVEHCLRVGKDELGMRHFEGRSWVGLMRHLTLVSLMLLFVAEQAEGLRKKKSGGNGGAGVPGAARDERIVDGAATRAEATAEEGAGVDGHSAPGDGPAISPTPQQGGTRVAAQAAA